MILSSYDNSPASGWLGPLTLFGVFVVACVFGLTYLKGSPAGYLDSRARRRMLHKLLFVALGGCVLAVLAFLYINFPVMGN